MKPRIRLRYGVWCCVTAIPFRCGCGYTPAEAYDEWKRIGEEQDGPAAVEHHSV